MPSLPIRCKLCSYVAARLNSEGDGYDCLRPKIVEEHKKNCYCLDNKISSVEVNHAATMHHRLCPLEIKVESEDSKKTAADLLIELAVRKIRFNPDSEEREIEETKKRCTVSRPHVSERTWVALANKMNESSPRAVWYPVYSGDTCLGLKKIERNN